MCTLSTLLYNKYSTAVFSIYAKNHYKARNRGLGFKGTKQFLRFSWLVFHNLNNLRWVFIELTDFNYTLSRNMPLRVNILKPHYIAGCKEKKLTYVTPF